MLAGQIWKKFNNDFEVSDQGRVRHIDGPPVPQHKSGGGYLFIIYNKKPAWQGMLYVHRMVLMTFRPNHAKCMNFCDHINRKRDDNRLVNLRWSNVVLNGMNKTDVKGFWRRATMCQPACRVLSRKYELGMCDTPAEATKVYLNFQTRAFELIEALMKRDIPVAVQQLIMDFWVQRLRGRKKSELRKSWLLSHSSLWTPQKRVLSPTKRNLRFTT